MEIFLIYIITLIITLSTLGYGSITFNFLNSPFYWVKEQQSEKIEIVGYGLNLTKGACRNIELTCIRGTHNLRINVRNNYLFFVKENEK